MLIKKDLGHHTRITAPQENHGRRLARRKGSNVLCTRQASLPSAIPLVSLLESLQGFTSIGHDRVRVGMGFGAQARKSSQQGAVAAVIVERSGARFKHGCPGTHDPGALSRARPTSQPPTEGKR